jgi:hypothetical protein
MIEIKLRVGDVDYDSLAELLLPAVLSRWGKARTALSGADFSFPRRA